MSFRLFSRVQARAFLFCSCLLIFFYSAKALANDDGVSLVVKRNALASTQYQVDFSGAPRMSQLIMQGVSLLEKNESSDFKYHTSLIYWPAAGLYKPQSDELNQLKKSTINQLQKLTALYKNKKETADTFLSLADFIKKNTFAERIDVELDIDKYLTNGQADPLVNENVLMTLPDNIQEITVIGAVKKKAVFNASAPLSVHNYVEKAEILNFFFPENVILINPDGRQQSISIAYFNRELRALHGGSVIYIPFDDLPSQHANLNQNIVHLLKNRVM